MAEAENVTTLLARIRASYGELRPAERRLADLILSFPGDIAGYAASELATMAKTSNAAVSRFVQRIGLRNYEEMRRLSREGIESGSPHFFLHAAGSTAQGAIAQYREATVAALTRTLEGLSDRETNDLARAAIRARRVWVIGVRHAHFIAAWLQWQLSHVRPDVHLVPVRGNTLGETIVDAGKGDLVVAVALRRRPRLLAPALAAFRTAGARIALIGDYSLADDHGAKWILRCDTRMSGPVDNHASVLAVAQLLLDRVIAIAGKSAARRFAQIDELHAALDELER